MPRILVGIDPGVETGIGVCFPNKDNYVDTLPIHTALSIVASLVGDENPVFVRVEDARKRKWFGDNSNAKKQGAGSVKRDCKIWDDFLTEVQKKNPGKLEFEMIHPVKGATKITSKIFKQITGIGTRNSQHARDAYMLIHGLRK